MIFYQTKTKKLAGTRHDEVKKEAMFLFNQIKKQTKRKPHVRSAYFKKEKIFFDCFWDHLFQKSPKERFRRLQYFGAALDLIKNSRNHPKISDNPFKKNEILYRFGGLTKDKVPFYVQIKEDKKSGAKYFMSCFMPQLNKKSPPKT